MGVGKRTYGRQYRWIRVRICVAGFMLALLGNLHAGKPMDYVCAETPRTIRFGICDGLGLFEVDEQGRISGYGYEYLMELSKYSGWNYEFITRDPETGEKLTVRNILTLLAEGELDMIGPLCHVANLEDHIHFSAYEMGVSYGILTTRDDTHYIKNSPSTFHGMRIGVLRGSNRNLVLYDYFQNRHVEDVTYVECEGVADLEKALAEGDVDAAYTDNMWSYQYDRELLRIEPSEFYLAFTADSSGMEEEVAAAQKQMLEEEPYYLYDLQKKYYRVEQEEIRFTAKEQEYLDSQPEIHVAVPLELPPYIYRDSKTGEITGVFVDILDDIRDKTGLRFRLEKQNGLNDMVAGINSGEGCPDMYLDLPSDRNWASKFNVRLTSDILYLDMSMITGMDYRDTRVDDDLTIAVLKYGYLTKLIEEAYPQAELLFCEDYIDCMEAVRKKKADITYVPQGFSELVHNKAKYRRLKSFDTNEFGYSIGFGISDACENELYSIINKAIDSIGEEQIRKYIMDRSFQYDSSEGIVDFLYRNYVVVAIVSSLFLLMIFCLIIVLYRSYKRAEKVHRADAEQFNLALSNTKIRVWDYDIKRHEVRLRLFGKDEHTVTVKNIPERQIENGVIHEESIEAYRKLYHALDEGEKIASGEVQMKDRNGEFHWIRITYTVTDILNNKHHAIGVTENIDEQKKAELNYRSEQILRQNMARESVYHFAVNLTRNSVEEAVRNQNGELVTLELYSMADVVDFISGNITSDSELRKIREMLDIPGLLHSHEDGLDHLKQKYYFLREDGDPEWHEMVLRMVENPFSGDLVVYLFVQNINQEQRDELLRENVDRMMKKAMDESFALLMFVDLDKAEYHIVNNSIDPSIPMEGSMQTIDKCLRRVMLPENWNILDDLNYPEKIKQRLQEMGMTVEEVRIRPEGREEYEWYELTSRSEMNVLTGRMGCTVLLRNIQSNKEAERQLENALEQAKQAARAKQEFLANMSHEIRTPLNGIRGILDIMGDDPAWSGNSYLEKASVSADHLIGLVNDILDMSKIDSGRIELRREFLPYHEIGRYLMAVMKPLADEKNIELIVQDVQLPYEGFVTDSGRLQQIYVNLISNAVKYTNPGGRVAISNTCEKIAEHRVKVVSVVADNGIGMSREFLQRAFEPFEQMDTSYNRKGTGLGLSITRRLVELMGGTISIESELGVGTTVTITLELEAMNEQEWSEENAIPMQQDQATIDVSGKRVLVVEDHPINMEIAVTQLAALGFEVDRAENGREAVEIFGASDPGYYQVIFMDIMMPVMDGLEATKTIRSMGRADAQSVTIVAMTANAFAEDIHKSLESGMDYHLSKPFDKEKLREIVSRICGKA